MTGPYPDGVYEIFNGDMAAYEKLEGEMFSKIAWVFFLPEWQFIDLVRFIRENRRLH